MIESWILLISGSVEGALFVFVLAEGDVESANHILGIGCRRVIQVRALHTNEVNGCPDELASEWKSAQEVIGGVGEEPADENIDDHVDDIAIFQNKVVTVWVAEEWLVVKDQHLQHVAGSGKCFTVSRESIPRWVMEFFWELSVIDQSRQPGPEDQIFGWLEEGADHEHARKSEIIGGIFVRRIDRSLEIVDGTELHQPWLPGLRGDPQVGEGLLVTLILPKEVPHRLAVDDLDDEAEPGDWRDEPKGNDTKNPCWNTHNIPDIEEWTVLLVGVPEVVQGETEKAGIAWGVAAVAKQIWHFLFYL